MDTRIYIYLYLHLFLQEVEKPKRQNTPHTKIPLKEKKGEMFAK